MAKLAVWLSGEVEYEKAADILRRVGQVEISASSVWRLSQHWGDKLLELDRWGAAGQANSSDAARHRPMGVTMDGTMIRLRGESWKELKIGCVFDVEVGPGRPTGTDEFQDLVRATHMSYVTHLGGPERLGERLWMEAHRRGWEHAPDTVVIGDGAAWLWNLAHTHFYTSRQIVDWYHAKEHLATAAKVWHGEGTIKAAQWLEKQAGVLFRGGAGEIAAQLETDAAQHPTLGNDLRREAGYFHNNQRRMNYLESRELGWPIGSGTVESGGKQYKARFGGPGMSWSRAGAERLLPIRSAILSQSFDATWRRIYNSPPN